MRKNAAISIIICLTLFTFISCGKKTGAPTAGTASAEDMLSLIPVDVEGVFFVDVNHAMSTEIAANEIREDEGYQKYQEFIEKTGIDPQKDIYFVAGAIKKITEDEKGEEKGVAIINLKYNKETLLPMIQEKVQEEGRELVEEDYNGFTLYTMWEEKKAVSFSFIDESNIVAGEGVIVKSVLDVLQKTKENVFKNEDLSALINETNTDAMFWAAILFHPETVEKLTQGNPMLSDLEGVKALSLYFDYKGKNIIAEIKIKGGEEAKNKQIAELLTGLKALGSMAAGEKPEVGELMNKIEITSGVDHVKIYASLPEDLINKLKEEKEDEKEEKN